MADILKPLAYHYTCLDTVQVRTFKNIELTVPLEVNLLSWLEDGDQLRGTQQQKANMMSLFG